MKISSQMRDKERSAMWLSRSTASRMDQGVFCETKVVYREVSSPKSSRNTESTSDEWFSLPIKNLSDLESSSISEVGPDADKDEDNALDPDDDDDDEEEDDDEEAKEEGDWS